MLRNHLKIAFRSIHRFPGYSSINIGGLGLGLACTFLIVLFIRHELSYDGFHANGDRIFRLTYSTDNGAERYANSAAGSAPTLIAAFPEIEQAVRLENFRSPSLRLPDGTIRRMEQLALADSGFFQVFSFPLLRGAPDEVLDEKYGIVLTDLSPGPTSATPIRWVGRSSTTILR